MKDFFYFTKKERRGIAILLGLSSILLLLPYLLAFTKVEPTIDFTEVNKAIALMKVRQDSIRDSLSQIRDTSKVTWEDKSFKTYPKQQEVALSTPRKLFAFNPNTASKAELQQLGIPARVSHTIDNYRKKGGKFFRKEDLKKIYGLQETLYQKLIPFIQLPDNKTPLHIDINKATAEEWQQLRGIGPSLSGRIVKFRDKLGGFISIEQVAQTYGLPDSTFQKIKSKLKASPIQKTIQINSWSKEELQQHPYINWKQAQILINYRKHHGKFDGQEAILQSKAFKKEELNKLLAYLNFD
ncbi:MAG: helix-hairpin-helix domain-containing protein [Saprospiraceae bacterium]|nr:helix-hairpin-helix domain-containing protein [Saprospiraceae bacterium]